MRAWHCIALLCIANPKIMWYAGAVVFFFFCRQMHVPGTWLYQDWMFEFSLSELWGDVIIEREHSFFSFLLCFIFSSPTPTHPRQVLRLTQKVRREYEPLDRGKYNWTEMKNTFDIQSPKLEEDTEEVIKLWFAEKKLSLPSKTWRLYVAESKYMSNMMCTVRSIRKK